MKIKKPEDEKYFKDIVLHDILEEISEETGAPKPSELKYKTTEKKQLFSKTILFIIITILFLIFIIALFRLVGDATQKTKPISPVTVHTVSETEDWKMPEDIVRAKNTTSHKIVKEKPMVSKKIHTKTIKVKPIKPKTRQKTERELAKEALRRQLLQ